MSTVTVITCTGSRTEAFDLCQSYMAAQTRQPDQWIVVHDGITDDEAKQLQADITHFELYAGPRKWREGLNTQRFNMEEALKHVRGDYVFVIDDDDYYAPEYIEKMVRVLESGVDVAGLSNNKYYNVSIPGFREMGNFRHSSLASTAFRKEFLPLLHAAVDSGELYFDIHFWEQARAQKLIITLLANSSLVIGIKGLPGRAGIGAGHKVAGFAIDRDLVKFNEWLGAAVDKYKPYVKTFAELPELSAAPAILKHTQSQMKRRGPSAVELAARAQPTLLAKQQAQAKQAPAPQPQRLPQDQVRQATPEQVQSNMERVLPRSLNNVPQSQSQKAMLAMMPQAPGNNPASAEVRQTSNTYPVGERTQMDQFK